MWFRGEYSEVDIWLEWYSGTLKERSTFWCHSGILIPYNLTTIHFQHISIMVQNFFPVLVRVIIFSTSYILLIIWTFPVYFQEDIFIQGPILHPLGFTLLPHMQNIKISAFYSNLTNRTSSLHYHYNLHYCLYFMIKNSFI